MQRFAEILVRYLIALAIVARAMIPAGYMPSDHGPGLMICPGMEAMRAHHIDMSAMDMSQKAPASSDHDHAPCVFSAAFAEGFTAVPVMPAVAMAVPREDFPALAETVLHSPADTKTFQSQGPPLSA